jgi:hypothetical protein
MGTTGGDRERLKAAAEAAGVYAVIAPQMGKQVGWYPLQQLHSEQTTCVTTTTS